MKSTVLITSHEKGAFLGANFANSLDVVAVVTAEASSSTSNTTNVINLDDSLLLAMVR